MLNLVIGLSLFLGSVLCERDYNVVIERLDKVQVDDEPDIEYIIRLTRRGRDDDRHVANGFLILNNALGEDVQHIIKTAYSADGTSHFRSYPYTVQESSSCEFFKTFYRKYGQPSFQNHSDFPYIPEEGLCPIPKGRYYVQNLTFDEMPIPEHAPRGLWKIEQKFERKGKAVGGLLIFVKITDKV